MLTLYRRHLSDCPHRSKGRKHKTCKCPIWVQGTLKGEPVRKSLDLTSWTAASAEILDWEANGRIGTPEPVSLSKAIETFTADLVARKVTESTQKKYKVLMAQLSKFAEDKRLQLQQFDFAQCSAFRASWTDGAISASKKLERLKSFFRFVAHAGWLPSNPAERLRPPAITEPPTMPLSEQELLDLVDFSDFRWGTLWYTLRFTGLRISDAMLLTPSHIQGETIFIRTMKTGVDVRLPIPLFLLERLKALEPCAYYFWNRQTDSKVETATGNARRALRRIGKLSKVKDAHPHRIRDSLACDLLSKGFSIPDVAAILGNSPRIVERHYSPWIQERQQRLEKQLRQSW